MNATIQMSEIFLFFSLPVASLPVPAASRCKLLLNNLKGTYNYRPTQHGPV